MTSTLILRLPIKPTGGHEDHWYQATSPSADITANNREALELLKEVRLYRLAPLITLDHLNLRERVQLVRFGNRLHQQSASVRQNRYLKNQEGALKQLANKLANDKPLINREEDYLESLNNECRPWLQQLLDLAEQLRP